MNKKNIFKILFFALALQNSCYGGIWSSIVDFFTQTPDQILGWAGSTIHDLTGDGAIPQLVPTALSLNAQKELEQLRINQEMANLLAKQTESQQAKTCLSIYKQQNAELEKLITDKSQKQQIIYDTEVTKTYSESYPIDSKTVQQKKEIISKAQAVAKKFDATCSINLVTTTKDNPPKDTITTCKPIWNPRSDEKICTKETQELQANAKQARNIKIEKNWWGMEIARDEQLTDIPYASPQITSSPINLEELNEDKIITSNPEGQTVTQKVELKCINKHIIPKQKTETIYPYHDPNTPSSKEQFEYAKTLLTGQQQANNELQQCLANSNEPNIHTRHIYLDRDGRNTCTTLEEELVKHNGKLIRIKDVINPKSDGFFSTLWEKLPETLKTTSKWVVITTVVVGGIVLTCYLIKNDMHNIKILLKPQTEANISQKLSEIKTNLDLINQKLQTTHALRNVQIINVPQEINNANNIQNLFESGFDNIERTLITVEQEIAQLQQNLRNPQAPVQQAQPQGQQAQPQGQAQVNVINNLQAQGGGGQNNQNNPDPNQYRPVYLCDIDMTITTINEKIESIRSLETSLKNEKKLGLFTTVLWTPIKYTGKGIKWGVIKTGNALRASWNWFNGLSTKYKIPFGALTTAALGTAGYFTYAYF